MRQQTNRMISTAVALCLLAVQPVRSAASIHTPATVDSLATLRKAIESDPDSLALHEQYIAALGLKDPALITQYERWNNQFPKSANVPYALGTALANKYSPEAKKWLLQAVERDPSLADAWQSLSFDAERWGDQEAGTYYMGKASEAAPESPDYAFYFASSHKHIDSAEYRSKMLDIVRRFPESERAPQALYWLAHEARDTLQKVAYYEQSLADFPPDKFRWSASSMSAYYQLLLATDPEKALLLAKRMTESPESGEQWKGQLQVAGQAAEAHRLLKSGKAQEASARMSEVKPGRIYGISETLALLATQAMAAAGNQQLAYDSLLTFYCKTPSDLSHLRLITYGAKLGKSKETVDADIQAKLENNAVPATGFELAQYLKPGAIKLEDLKGKVVLVTYWFPGCGPCRGEFPHFENVLKKYDREQVVYLGINIVPEQDGYVKPFMESTGYTFIPLREEEGRDKGNMDNRGAAPVNFLINPDGEVVFSNFMINANNERMLERMIEALL